MDNVRLVVEKKNGSLKRGIKASNFERGEKGEIKEKIEK